MFGLNFLGPLGMATMGDGRPDNSPADTNALTAAYAAARAHNRTPAGRVARGFDQFGPQASQPAAPMLPTTPGPPNMGPPASSPPPALSPQAMAPSPPAAAPAPAPAVTMPTPRPPDAPQAPPQMSWFQRNAAMMRDPVSGQFIDPTNAATAERQASGPDVINKLMSYFHKKGDPSDT